MSDRDGLAALIYGLDLPARYALDPDESGEIADAILARWRLVPVDPVAKTSGRTLQYILDNQDDIADHFERGHKWTITLGDPTAHCKCGATMNVPVIDA